ncbi:MAG: phosphatase PAP2 family protein [Mycobacteriales bacterium]
MDLRGSLASVRRRIGTRPVWWQELALIAICFGLYTLTSDHSPLRVGFADRMGERLRRLEEFLHIDIEHSLNNELAGNHLLAFIVNYYYLAMHFLVAAAVLVWLFVRRPNGYRDTRRVLLASVLLSVVCFWLVPTTPPRLMPGTGFVDTLAKYHAIGGYQSGPTAQANQYAALPSDHLAFASWVAWAMFRDARHRLIRCAWLLYPVATAYAVIATGTHWLLDVVAGVVTFALAALLVSAGLRLRDRLRPPGAGAAQPDLESSAAP